MSTGSHVLSSAAQSVFMHQRGCVVGCCLFSKAKTEASNLKTYEKRLPYGLDGTSSLTGTNVLEKVKVPDMIATAFTGWSWSLRSKPGRV